MKVGDLVKLKEDSWKISHPMFGRVFLVSTTWEGSSGTRYVKIHGFRHRTGHRQSHSSPWIREVSLEVVNESR